MNAPVIFEEIPAASKKIGRATLNVEKSLNSLSLAMVELLLAKLAQWQTDPDIACVFLDASGDKAFCAGGDIVKLYESMVACGAEKPNPYAENFFGQEYRLDYLIHTYRKPLVVWGHGIVMGGGVGLMSGASHRVVTEKSRIAMPEIGIGLFPDVGSTYFLQRTPARSGLFLGLTGANFNASDALFIGFADRFILHDRKAAVLDALASEHFADGYEQVSSQVSGVLREFEKRDKEHLPAGNIETSLRWIKQVCDGDSCREVVENILATPPENSWQEKAQVTLAKGCPVTMHLVWQQLRRGRHLSLAEIFQMEFIMAVQCARQGDFQEGVRALLIDKDGKPRWQHASVSDVPAEVVASHFESLWELHPLKDLSGNQDSILIG